MSGMNLDEFLGHSSTARGNGGGKIVNWRKKEPPQIDTWLHTKSPIVAVWRHGWPRIAEIDRDGTKTREVWGGTFNCWESEDVLRKQYRRADDGSRIMPPSTCPICLMIEWVRTEVAAGRLSWVEPLFKFEGDDADKATIITAGGLYNAFGGDLSRQEIADLRRAGIRRDEAWKQNMMAKCSYVFAIVDHEDPSKGVQTAVETTALGDAVKRVIRDQIDSLGAVEGHPFRTPYAIRWQYRPKEVEFSKKYHALAMPRLACSAEIRDLIENSPPPDLSAIINRGNAVALHAAMAAHALVDLPLDRFFAAAEGASQLPAPRAQDPAPAPTPAARRKPPVKAEPVAPVYPPGTDTLPCDECGAVMAATDATCWKCGAQYEVDAAPAAPAPAKPKTTTDKWPGADSDDDVGF